jgi:tetratricopeptide (TPR) repeat protein
MNTARSDIIFRPSLMVFILTLLWFCLLTTGCLTKQPPPVQSKQVLVPSEAATAGSQALFMRGMLHENATNPAPDKAANAYANAVSLNPRNISALKSLIRLQLRNKQTQKAYQTLCSNPCSLKDNPELTFLAASLAELLEKPMEAAKWCRKTLHYAPTNAVVANAAVRLYFESNAEKQALKTLSIFASSLPSEQAFTFITATARSLYSEVDHATSHKALICHQRAADFITTDQQHYDFMMLRGGYQIMSAQTNQAMRSYEKALQIKPRSHVTLMHLASIYAASPGLLERLEAASPSLEDDATPGSSLLLRGYIYSILERIDDAVKMFEDHYTECLRTECPVKPEFFIALGQLYERQRAYTSFDTLFSDAVQRYPNNSALLNFAAYLWAERSVHLDKALQFVNLALSLEPENPAYLDTKGWVLHRKKRNYEALQYLLKASAYDNQEPVILDHTGDVLLAVGDDALAIEFWKRSYQINPQPPVADKLRRMGDMPPEPDSSSDSNDRPGAFL